jgi:hypothetical protein
MIIDEIKKMFDSGTTSEASLNKLDRALSTKIMRARENPPAVKPEEPIVVKQ